MPATDDYELVDAGSGRRLERFGGRLVDRPALSAGAPARLPASTWAAADLRFERGGGWAGGRAPWQLTFHGLTLELRPTDTGQVGLFPEHAHLWPWMEAAVGRRRGAEVLHLFAYTGATTLALARAGARVTHVDAARSAVGWARRNAELSRIGDEPIRWIVDDAAGFVSREIRRERRYDGIVLDPPAWGHGAGRAWRLQDDLGDLVAACTRLLEKRGWLVLTAHSTGWDAGRLAHAVRDALHDGAVPEGGDLVLEARSGAVLSAGAYVRAVVD